MVSLNNGWYLEMEIAFTSRTSTMLLDPTKSSGCTFLTELNWTEKQSIASGKNIPRQNVRLVRERMMRAIPRDTHAIVSRHIITRKRGEIIA